MVKLWCSASDRLRVPARPAPHVHRGVPEVGRRTRRSAAAVGGGAPYLTIGCAAADRAGARPYLRRRPSRPVYYFSGCTLRNKGQAAAISTRLGCSDLFPVFVVVDCTGFESSRARSIDLNEVPTDARWHKKRRTQYERFPRHDSSTGPMQPPPGRK